MFNKLSFKIGLLFFVFILIIESLLFFILYTNLVNDRVEEVMDNLLARGNTHSAVLEDNFESPTLKHVGLMESASDYAVIITDATGNILIDRKSTRLNSSHVSISYAVFCLKKKKTNESITVDI